MARQNGIALARTQVTTLKRNGALWFFNFLTDAGWKPSQSWGLIEAQTERDRYMIRIALIASGADEVDAIAHASKFTSGDWAKHARAAT